MTQNGPGTATGSQGVFGAKGVGSGMGARQLFRAGVCLAQLPGHVLNFLFAGKLIKKSLRLNKLVYSPLKTVDKFQSGPASCELARTITKMVLS
jgi:hypothetical protein